MATDNNIIQNDFGAEFEVFTHSFTNVNKTQNLALEQRGNITVDVSTRFQLDQNVFFLETAPDKKFAAPIEELHKFNIDDLISDIRNRVSYVSATGFDQLYEIFKAIDE